MRDWGSAMGGNGRPSFEDRAEWEVCLYWSPSVPVSCLDSRVYRYL